MSTSRRRKPAYHHGNLVAGLLQAAGQVIENEGIQGLKLRGLARRAGVSHGAPYRHFPDREALLAALAAEGFEWLAQALRESAAAGGLRSMGVAYVRFALAHPQRFRLMFGGEVPLAKHARLRDAATSAFDGLSRALAASVPGAPGAGDCSVAAWALVHGLAQLLLGGQVPGAASRGRDDATFVREVLASVRFAAGRVQPPA